MKNTDNKTTAILFIVYAAFVMAAYSILAAVFEFPEILRKPITERFALFHLHESIIIPTYYVFALTGVLQIFFSIYLFKINNTTSSNGLSSLIFGVCWRSLAGY